MNVIGIVGQTKSGKTTAAQRLVDEFDCIQIACADPMKRLVRRVFDFSDKQLWGPSQFRDKHDKRFNTYVMDTDPAWTEALNQLKIRGRDWVENELGITAPGKANDAYKRLVHWFHWLGQHHPALSPRVALQTLGSEYGRDQLGEDVWIDRALATAQKLLKEDGDAETYWDYSHSAGVFSVGQQPRNYRGVIISDIRFHNELLAIKAIGGRLIRIYRPSTDGDSVDTGIGNHSSETEQQTFDDSIFSCVIQNDKTLEEFYDVIDLFGSTIIR